MRFRKEYLPWLLVPFLLWWAFSQVDWQQVGAALGHLRFVHLFMLAALNSVILLTFAMRWWLLLMSSGQKYPLFLLVRYWLIGFAFSYYLPGPQMGGGILQIYFMQREQEILPELAAATVIASKVLERLGNLIFLLVGVSLMVRLGFLEGVLTGQVAWLLAGLVFLPIAYLLALARGSRPLAAVLHRLPGTWRRRPRLTRVIGFVAATERDIGRLGREAPLALAAGVGITLASWVLVVWETWLALHFLGAPLPVAAAVVLVAAVQLAYLAPVPIGLGSVEAALVAVLQPLGYSAATAISLALLMRIRDGIIGGVGIWLGGQTAWNWWRHPPNREAGAS